MHGDCRAPAEPDDVDVTVASGELLRDVELRLLDSFVSADAEGAAGYLPEETVFGPDALVEVLRARVRVLEPHHVGVPAVLTGVLFRVPCTVERI